MLKLANCPKAYTRDQDKAMLPEETVARVKAVLAEKCEGVLAETDRVDTGRLGIPVFVSTCGPKAAHVMPTRKQMGKGASPEQAEASALMELVERFSYFSFWDEESNFERMTWSEAERAWPGRVLPIESVLASVGESLDPETAISIMDLVRWRFHPLLDVAAGEEVVVPLDWFKILNEFNGSSAGNTPEESILQGGCELVERHVSALADREEPELPTIDPDSSDDPVLAELVNCFRTNGIDLLLKDMSMDMPVPTVGAIAWDRSTFPGMSEIVFTAGTSSSPEKAAIRAITEVAQLAGDFHTGRVYEASGLSKYTELSQVEWLRRGPVVALSTLPSVERDDIYEELMALAEGLKERGYTLLTADTTHPDIQVPANYNVVPGFDFRERTTHRSLGLFVGRLLAESGSDSDALFGLQVLESVYPEAHFVPFFKGMLELRTGEYEQAQQHFADSEPLQPAAEERALAAFYQAHALSLLERWEEAVAHLDRAIGLDPEIQQALNLRGVAHFKAGRFARAAGDFQAALDLDTGQPQILANLGACHRRLGNTDQAEDYFASALAMDPSLDGARSQLEEIRREKEGRDASGGAV